MKNQRGNILFLILLAIVLFAALSYAVTSSTQGGGKNASDENLQSTVSTIHNFFAQVDAAVMRLRTTGGFSNPQISFQHTQRWVDGYMWGVAFENGNCTSAACRVFLPTGGGVAAQNFALYGVDNPNDPSSSVAPGYLSVQTAGRYPYAGTDANDTILVINKIEPNICIELNKRLNLPDPAVANPASGDISPYLGKDTYGRNVTANGITRCYIYHLVITN